MIQVIDNITQKFLFDIISLGFVPSKGEYITDESGHTYIVVQRAIHVIDSKDWVLKSYNKVWRFKLYVEKI